jgi:hypothetical protein
MTGHFFDIPYAGTFEPYVLGYQHGKSRVQKNEMKLSFPSTYQSQLTTSCFVVSMDSSLLASISGVRL